MRVDSEREPERGAALGAVTEAELDHPAVEDLQGVMRPESKRAPRMRERFPAAPVLVERPAEDVVAVDRLALAVGVCRTGERIGGVSAVVEIEESGLEFRPDSVRPQELLRRIDDGIGVVGRRVPPGEPEDEASFCGSGSFATARP
jgi:hypothetical protein